jgi:hypothetical protein
MKMIIKIFLIKNKIILIKIKKQLLLELILMMKKLLNMLILMKMI